MGPPSCESRRPPLSRGSADEADAVLNSINTSQLTKRGPWKYSAKCVTSGDHVEVYEYHQARTGVRVGKKSAIREQKKREVRMDNVFRAKREVKRLVNANVRRHVKENETDKFLTLTFAENVTDIQLANRHFHNYMKKLRYHFGSFEYVGVPAIQWERYKKYGAKVWHYHVALFGFPYIPQKRLLQMWGRGTVSIEAMDDKENPGVYMSRYMGKDFGAEELTGHRTSDSSARARRSS